MKRISEVNLFSGIVSLEKKEVIEGEGWSPFHFNHRIQSLVGKWYENQSDEIETTFCNGVVLKPNKSKVKPQDILCLSGCIPSVKIGLKILGGKNYNSENQTIKCVNMNAEESI